MFTSLNQWIKTNPGKFLTMVLPFIFTSIGSISMTGYEAVQSYMTGSRYGESSYHLKQKALWEKNMGCLQNAEIKNIINPHNVEIGSLVCPTGDILISARRPVDNQPVFKWVGWGDIMEETSSLELSLFSEAVAGVYNSAKITDNYQVRVLCQYMKGSYLIQVVTDGVNCVTYVINPYNGQVISSYNGCNC